MHCVSWRLPLHAPLFSQETGFSFPRQIGPLSWNSVLWLSLSATQFTTMPLFLSGWSSMCLQNVTWEPVVEISASFPFLHKTGNFEQGESAVCLVFNLLSPRSQVWTELARILSVKTQLKALKWQHQKIWRGLRGVYPQDIGRIQRNCRSRAWSMATACRLREEAGRLGEAKTHAQIP